MGFMVSGSGGNLIVVVIPGGGGYGMHHERQLEALSHLERSG